MYQRILVANRGEIALRIIRACRELGVETVAIFSEADRGARYLDLADEAYCVGPAKASDSYLKIASVISAAEVGNVQAIHPGYGFLAENAHFNEICRSCKIDFIGPSPEAMAQLGRQERRARSRAANGRAGGPGQRRRYFERRRGAAVCSRGRLSRADQSGCRRRRPGHARGLERSRTQVGAATSPGGSGSRVRQRRCVFGEIRRAPATRRGAGAGRSPRQASCIFGNAIAACSDGTRS